MSTTLDTSLGQGSVGIRMSESATGNESVLRLLRHVCRTLGIDLDAVKLVDMSTQETNRQHIEKTEAASVFDDELSLENSESYGWSELQVGIIREAVAVAEALPGKRVL